MSRSGVWCSRFVTDERALSPVVEKTLASGLAIVYISGMLGLLLGGVVPDYETSTSEELSERITATTAEHIERSLPETSGQVDVTTTVDLPGTIQNTGYQLMLENETLKLEHPDATVERETTLALETNVTTQPSTVLGGEIHIHIEGPAENRTVSLEGS